MAKVQIVIKNQSDTRPQFLVFSERSPYSANTRKVWTNVWCKTPPIGPVDGTVVFNFYEQYYAICGVGKYALANGLEVSASDYEPVTLGSGTGEATNIMVQIRDGGAKIDRTKKLPGIDRDGAFGIETSSYDFTQYKNAFCGLGMRDITSEEPAVMPVSVWQADLNRQYQIAPKRAYRVCLGSFKPGTIIDVAELGKHATIDFTGKEETTATVIYNEQRSLEPAVYSF
ncbi:hypothetical protein MBLNU459_g2017t1 [Dothideomycetes sp. NU459]